MKTQQTCSPLNRKEFYDTVFNVHRVFLKMSQFSAKYLSDFFFFLFFLSTFPFQMNSNTPPQSTGETDVHA